MRGSKLHRRGRTDPAGRDPVGDRSPLATRVAIGWALGVFALALLLRAAHVISIRGTPLVSELMLDSELYDAWGRRIAAGEWIGDAPFFQDPLYAYFLGALYAVVGARPAIVVLIQVLLGALVPVLILHAAGRWCDRAVARLAAAMAAVYLPSIFYEGLILKTALGLFLVTVLLWMLSRPAPARTGPWLLVAGLVAGLGCLTRGNLVLVVPVLAAWLVWDVEPSAPRDTLQGRLRAAWPFVGGVAVILAVSTAHNRIAGGEWIVTTSNAGQNFFIGNNPLNDTGEYAWLPFVNPNPEHEERDFAAEARRRSGRELSAARTSRFWFAEALDWIVGDPGRWLALEWRKVRNYWGAYEIPDNLDYYLARESAPVLRLPLPGFGLVAPLGLLGLALSLRRKGWIRALVLFVGIYSMSVVAFFVFARFRMAMMPALFVFAAHGVVELARRARAAWGDRAQRRPLGVACGLLLVGFAFVNVPVRARRDAWSYRVASALGVPTRVETSALAHYNLGLVYAAEAKQAADPASLLRRAEDELRKAVEADPGHSKIRIELGKVLARQQRNAEAIAVYRAAEALDPANYRIQHALGLLHRRVGDAKSAEIAFARSLALAPRFAASATGLGQALLDQGRAVEAVQAFLRALEHSPGDAAAQRGLAQARLRAAEASGQPN